jgi:RNA-binding protein
MDFATKPGPSVRPAAMDKLPGKQLRWLRSKAHHLKPIVIIGTHRVSEGVVKHVDAALEQHELIKVRLTAADKAEVLAAATELVSGTDAVLVQRVGHTLVLYRRRLQGAPTLRIPG